MPADGPRPGAFLRAALLVLAAASAGAVEPNHNSPLGINLAAVADWSTELPFVDVFRTSREWISQSRTSGAWDTGEPLDLDADGWVRSLRPDQFAMTLMCT